MSICLCWAHGATNVLTISRASFDVGVCVCLQNGTLVKKYQGDTDVGGIFEVCWNKSGSKIAACFSNKKVIVVEFQL